MIHILGLLARAGAGKTTVANHLVRTYGAVVCPLAGPLKAVAKKVMCFSDEQLWGTQAQKEAVDPRYGFSAREFLQRLGTEGLREEYGEDVHFRACINHVRRLDDEATCDRLYVIDDVRFLSEVYALTDAEAPWVARVIRLVCPDAPTTRTSEAPEEVVDLLPEHASEAEVDKAPDECLTATITCTRAEGPWELIRRVEAVLPEIRPFARVLREGRERASVRRVA